MDEKTVFARNLNALMDRNGKTQADIINDLGVNKSTISTWCQGKKMPRMGTIQTLADYFGVMKSDLIEDEPVTDNSDGLSEQDKLLSDLFKGMSESEKDEMLNYARYLKSRNQ